MAIDEENDSKDKGAISRRRMCQVGNYSPGTFRSWEDATNVPEIAEAQPRRLWSILSEDKAAGST
jgi:hypothetical protein